MNIAEFKKIITEAVGRRGFIVYDSTDPDFSHFEDNQIVFIRDERATFAVVVIKVDYRKGDTIEFVKQKIK